MMSPETEAELMAYVDRERAKAFVLSDNKAYKSAISTAAHALDVARTRALASDDKLTMTGLYNHKPDWLERIHKTLDDVVLDAYGWPRDISDDDLLQRLLELNQQRYDEEQAHMQGGDNE